MLPPQMPTDIPREHRESHPFRHLKEQIIEDAGKVKAYIEDEESKLGQYVKKEEGVFEDFVHKEEDQIEGLVKSEEHRLSDFVKKEEGKLKHFVQEEEETWHHRHHSSDKGRGSRSNSPFRTDNLFGASSTRSKDQLPRSETMIGPGEVDNGPGKHDGADSRLMLDGAGTEKPVNMNRTISKAELLSDMYRDCLIRPISTDIKPTQEAALMPPPALKPVKARTPDKPTSLDPKATIRRFPSVTVVDDRKGHLRSVSLISVKTSRSHGFERSSTHDLLELIKVREAAEKEKLMNGFAKEGHLVIETEI